MKVLLSLRVLLIVECITGLDPALDGDPRRTFPARRAIDGSRGRKYYMPEEEEDLFDIYGFGGQYDAYRDTTDFADIRTNVPGEPGVDYPSYVTIPQTSFQCQREFRGYYADEEAGCQLFHVCDGTFLVSSFLCPIGSIFSQKLLTCDWWNKVDCSSTRPYFAVNHDIIPTEVDDDEILHKAYEMTSLQASPNDLSPAARSRNSIVETARSINDLQSTPNRYGDYDYPDIQYKYSSRYSSDQPKSADNQRNPKIKVHTIGQDHNDAEGRDFRPSYAPTVPTVTTTTRRFYSPTVPTTSARPMARPGYDLDFESSDHLYSARGKTQAPTTPPPVTKPTVDTTTVVVEVPPVQQRIDASAPGIDLSRADITMDKSRLVSEFSAIEFQSVYSGENHTFQIDVDQEPVKGKAVEIPSTHMIPPFFYYSNVDQHQVVTAGEPLEGNSTSPSPFIINVPATDVIPPFLKDLTNGSRNQVVGSGGSVAEGSNDLSGIRSAEGTASENSIATPSRLFLPPLDGLLETSTKAKEPLEKSRANGDASGDSTGGGSSAVQVALAVEGELNQSRSSKNSWDRDGSSVESEVGTEGLEEQSATDSTAAGDVSRAQIINYVVLDKLQGGRPRGSLKSPQHPDHFPRPFSLDVEVTTEGLGVRSNGSREFEELKEKKEILRAGAHSFDRADVVVDAPLKFELPYVSRAVDFRGEKGDLEGKGEELGVQGANLGGKGEELRVKEEDLAENGKNEEEFAGDFGEDTSTETEFIPSIGFSLNTDEDRQKYSDAVARGLFDDPSIDRNSTRSNES